MKKILFVCLGNICRSAAAEEIMRVLIKRAGYEKEIEVDSAGISSYHQGDPADIRMRDHARCRGYEILHLSRPVCIDDFYHFDLIIGMDDYNIETLKEKAPNDHVPDPYYGGSEGFENVLDILEDACSGLLEALLSR